jgi:hypothetical protein
MKDLGFMNNWKYIIENNRFIYLPEDNAEYLSCREQKHELQEISHSYRGSDTEYICEICQIKWHVDSSD